MALEIKQALDVIEQGNIELQIKKNTIATTLSNKEVSTQGTDSFDTITANVKSIETKLPIPEGSMGVAEDIEGKRYSITQIDSKRVYHEMGETLETVWEKADVSSKSVTIDNKGYIYVAINGFSDPAILRKLSKNGETLWEYSIPSQINTVFTDSKRNVYIYCRSTVTYFDKHAVIKLDSNGNFLWEYELNDDMQYLITVDKEGSVIIYEKTESILIKLDTNSNLVFEKSVMRRKMTTPCIATDKNNNIYIANEYVIKIDPNGQEIYNLSLSQQIGIGTTISPASINIAEDGYLYLGMVGKNGMVYKIEESERTLQLVWSYEASADIIIIDNDNYIYCFYKGKIVKINFNSELVYTYALTDSNGLGINNEGDMYASYGYPTNKLGKYKDDYIVEKTATLKELE